MGHKTAQPKLADVILLAFAVEAGVAILNLALVAGIRWLITPGED